MSVCVFARAAADDEAVGARGVGALRQYVAQADAGCAAAKARYLEWMVCYEFGE